jgi:hypothetical protein
VKFDPKIGEIRASKTDDGELRASLQQYGWHQEFPALLDEHGHVLVGNRRMRLAKALGIEPVTKELRLGAGSEADAERIKLALISNIGGAPLTKEDRKRIAEHLYGEREWTMDKIAKALNVSQNTISLDLCDLSTIDKSNKQPKTASNPKGSGRRKGSRKPTPRQEQNAERNERIVSLRDAGRSTAEIAADVGVHEPVVSQQIEHERISREAAGTVDAKTLSMTAQEKLDSAIRAAKKKLEAEFRLRVMEESNRSLNEVRLPAYLKHIEAIEYSIKNRKGVMDRISYRKIVSCLHPDRVQDPVLQKRYEEAFRIFTELEKVLLDEKQSPTEFRKMPSTVEELRAMKAKMQAERRAQRAQRANVSVR